jgi:hypothetical protein
MIGADIWSSYGKIDKTSDEMAIAHRIKERITIRSTNLNIELHKSLNNTLITKSSTTTKF